MICSMNNLRISSRAASTASWPDRGMTLAAQRTSLPPLFKTSQTSRDTTWLPAITIGTDSPERANKRALLRIVAESPPSVPPVRRIMSGRCASISPIAFSASLNDQDPTTLAPAPRAAVFAASTVRPGTNPMTAIRNPPAALLEARTSLSSNAVRSAGRSVNNECFSSSVTRA